MKDIVANILDEYEGHIWKIMRVPSKTVVQISISIYARRALIARMNIFYIVSEDGNEEVSK